MHLSTRNIFGIILLILLAGVVWTGIGPVHADCRWVHLGADSYWICDEDDTPKVTKRVGPGEPIARIEPPRPTNRIVQAVPVMANEQGEPRESIERAKPRKPAKRRRSQSPEPQWVSQRFRTSVMGARVKGTFERRGDDVRGVVYVLPPFGGKDTYHFTGKIQGNRVVASHHGGHRFQGEIVGGNKLVGVVTTRGGTRIPLDVPVGSR